MPTVMVGSAQQIRDDVERARERFGLTYLITSDQDLDTLEQVLA
jgi:hypothetical protein